MADENQQARLVSLLTQEEEAAGLLLQSLEEEFTALKAHNAPALEQAVSQKQNCVERLEATGRQRMGLLNQPAGPADAKAIEQRLQDQDKTGNLVQLWRQLQDTATRCQEHNRRNGRLVSAHQDRVTQILGILRGQPIKSGLYGPDGSTVSGSDPHTMVKA
ncbi:MAG TPA: flagellar protein FlgN [Acidiferrobacteraceae bacterium]|nr:flagellar protein FlgN [Acidiferrobacteraceae bacterium]